MDLIAYRQSATEQARIGDLLAIVPGKRKSVLDIGARDGYISQKLSSLFDSVTALDLEMPQFQFERVTPVKGDVTALQFPDGSFDTVVCSEVLEHIRPELVRKACAEIVRVARHDIVIGVPYRQDLRAGRARCGFCGGELPPWGHLNSFDERRLKELFRPVHPVSKSFVGEGTGTNAISAMLMDLAGNPWAVYDQEFCPHCGERFVPATGRRPLWRRGCSAAAELLNRLQNRLSARRPAWIHMVFQK